MNAPSPQGAILASIAVQSPGDFRLNSPPAQAPAVELIAALLSRGLSKAGIARQIGVDPAQITRISGGQQTASPETHRRLLALAADTPAPDDPPADPKAERPRCDKTPDLFSDPPPEAEPELRANLPEVETSEPEPPAIPVTHDKDEPVPPPDPDPAPSKEPPWKPLGESGIKVRRDPDGEPIDYLLLLPDGETVKAHCDINGGYVAPDRQEVYSSDGKVTSLSGNRRRETPSGWKLKPDGVCEIKQTENETKLVPICGHLRVTGRTTGAHGQWGLVLAFRDHDGRELTKAIASSRLHEDAGILARELSDEGLWIEPGKEKRLLSYIAGWRPETRILSAKRLGWIEDKAGALAFVMPDRVITRDGSGQVVFQPDRFSPTIRTVHGSGALSDWQAQVAGPVCQHPPMLFALCAGLAPALLAFSEAGDSFVLHFWGKTSRGKTTVGQIAASPWGCAADPNDAPSLTFVRRWNITGNGLEGLAESHSDMPLVLDELGSSTVGDIRPLIYQLAGGQGKTALNSAREMKEPRSWRTIAVSTGELSLHARMSDPTGDGTQARTIKGGLTHRALDVEIADIASGLPAEQRGAAVTAIKTACARHYGTAGPELIRLIAERFATHAQARAYVRDRLTALLPKLAPADLPAETERAIRRFALIAVAGEFASLTGLIPATVEQVIEAVKDVAGKWLSVSAETDDERIVSSVRAFILRHEARFQRISEPESIVVGPYPRPLKDEPVRDRVGYVDRHAGKWMFTDAGLVEAAPGHDRTTIARTLRKHGYLFTNSDKMTTPITIGESRPRLYVVKASIIEGCEGEKTGNLSKTGVQGVQGVRDQQPQGFEPAHLADGQGVQGVQQGVQAPDTPGIAHPAHLHDGQGVQHETLAVTGIAHPAHPTHPKNGDTEKNPDILTDEDPLNV